MTVLGKLSGEFSPGVMLVADEQATDETPPWSTPDDMVTASLSSMVLRVQHSDDGPVKVRVLSDHDEAQGERTFSGIIHVDSGNLVLSDAQMLNQLSIALAPGVWHVSVYAEDRTEAKAVDIVLQPVAR